MSNYLSQSWLIDRRHALKALGTFIALPMLECMIPLRAGAAGKATVTPRRSAFIYLANGVHSLNYQITTEGGATGFPDRFCRWKSTATSSRRSAVSITRAASVITTTASASG